MLTKTAFVALALTISPALAGPPMNCITGDPAKVMEAWRDKFGMKSILKMDILVSGDRVFPGIIMASPDGTFAVVILVNGTVCEVIEGAHMGPSRSDESFASPDGPATPDQGHKPFNPTPAPGERGT